DGQIRYVTAVRTFTGSKVMRDLTVDDIHTYYVMAGEQPVLVHNCGGGTGTAAETGSPTSQGGAGVQVPGRMSPQELAALSNEHGVEFALTYKAGSGKNGGGGSYWLHSGQRRRVMVPIGADERLIYHTHPGGTPYASKGDINVLNLLRQAGSPQRSSQIVLPDASTVRFSDITQGGKWMRDGTFVP
ncbi:hypothetical protein AB0C02_33440, partial [Micromonospora sp. NPDC048999]|uniref:hypothetical protein n=1 Tax=Micromonospora sp. NPDC048999 TaxID=3155391 RepID=UPI003406BCB8